MHCDWSPTYIVSQELLCLGHQHETLQEETQRQEQSVHRACACGFPDGRQATAAQAA